MSDIDAWFKNHDIGEVSQRLVSDVPDGPLDASGCGEFYVRFGMFGDKHWLYVNEKKFIEWLKLTDEIFQ